MGAYRPPPSKHLDSTTGPQEQGSFAASKAIAPSFAGRSEAQPLRRPCTTSFNWDGLEDDGPAHIYVSNASPAASGGAVLLSDSGSATETLTVVKT
jgi:hypothetical protein